MTPPVASCSISLATSVTGLWTEAEIRASFTLGLGGFLAVLAVALVLMGAVAIWGRELKGDLQSAITIGVVFTMLYAAFVHVLAEAQFVEAPLGIWVHGVFTIPFFLGAKVPGLIGLLLISSSADFALLRARGSRQPLMATISFNAAAVCGLALAAVVAVKVALGG